MNEKLNQVHAFVDGELSVDEREQVLRSIESDPELAKEYEWAHLLKDVVHQKGQVEAPEGGWKACRARIAEMEKVKTTNHVVAKYGWLLCSVLFAGVATAGFLNHRNKATNLSTASVAGLFDFSPAKAKAIKEPSKPFPVFDDLQLNTKDGAKFDFEEQFWNPDQSIAAVQVQMEDAGGPYAVTVIPGQKSFPGIDQPVGYSDYKVGIVNSHPCLSWTNGRYLLVISADRNWDQLEEAADRVR